MLGEERNARVRVLTFLGLDHHVLGDEFVPDEQFREAYLRVAEANEEPDIIARIYRREAAVNDMYRANRARLPARGRMPSGGGDAAPSFDLFARAARR